MSRVIPFLLLSTACSYSPGYIGGDVGLGVTPGGVQDIDYAREIIAGGGIPQSTAFPVEGLLSQHHIPVDGSPCEDLICARPAIGTALDLETGQERTWLQIGLTSALSTDFQRPPVDLVVVIDASASMQGDMVETNEAVARLMEQLRPDDRLEVIAANSTLTTVHPLGAVNDTGRLRADIHSIQARGAVSLEDGIEQGFETLADVSTPDRLQRVIALTCVYPYIHGGFGQTVTTYADEGIGLTMVGLLLGYEPNAADLLGRVHGGSYAYVQDLPSITALFDEELDHRLTPLAYDLDLHVEGMGDWSIDTTYGIPGQAGTASTQITTAFASQRSGAMFATLTGSGDRAAATVDLSYVPEPAIGFTEPSGDERERIANAGPTTPTGVTLGAALVNQAIQMARAVDEFRAGDREDAIQRLSRLSEHMTEVASQLDHAGLRDENQLVQDLIRNMR